MGGAGPHSAPTRHPQQSPEQSRGPSELGAGRRLRLAAGGGGPLVVRDSVEAGTGGAAGKAGLTHRQGWVRPQTTALGEEGTRLEPPQRWRHWGQGRGWGWGCGDEAKGRSVPAESWCWGGEAPQGRKRCSGCGRRHRWRGARSELTAKRPHSAQGRKERGRQATGVTARGDCQKLQEGWRL